MNAANILNGARCGIIVFFSATVLLSAGDWPQWRGPTRSGHAGTSTGQAIAVPRELKADWKVPIGGGFSSPVMAKGTVVYLDVQGDQEVAHALDARTGKELWQTSYAAAYGDEWGTGPRATPIIDDDRVYVQSCNGELRCLQLADGKTVWRANFDTDFGVKFLGSKAREGTASRRGNNGSGVIDGDRYFVPVGQTNGASLVCFDKQTGRVLWKSGDDEAAYSSFMVATLAGVRQVVAFTADALLGAEVSNGRILWRVPLKTNAKRHAASPVVVGDRVIVNSHTIGTLCFQIAKEGSGLQASEAWANTELKINLATPTHVGGYIYCQGANKDLVCVDVTTGKLRWTQPGFGSGKRDYASTVAVGNQLLVLAEDGQLLHVAANPDKYTELARLQVCGSTWSHPAFADGKLLVRDGRQLLCVDLAAPAKASGF